jgi:hypothetical protein
MSLLVTVVLLDVVQVITTDDDGALHLGGDDGSGEDTAANADITSEWALLIDVSSSNGLGGGLETQTDVLEPASTLALGDDTLVVLEDSLLLLERTMSLEGEKNGNVIRMGRH